MATTSTQFMGDMKKLGNFLTGCTNCGGHGGGKGGVEGCACGGGGVGVCRVRGARARTHARVCARARRVCVRMCAGGVVSGGAHELDAELDGEEGDAYHLDPCPRLLGDVGQQLRHRLKHHGQCRHKDDHHDLPRGGRQWAAAAAVAVAVVVAAAAAAAVAAAAAAAAAAAVAVVAAAAAAMFPEIDAKGRGKRKEEGDAPSGR